MEIRSIWLKWYEESPLLPERRHDKKSDRPGLPRGGRGRHVLWLTGDGLRFPACGCRLSSPLTVLAGASEFMFIGIVASGGNPLAAAAAGLLVNARHVPFGVTVRELVGKRGLSFLGCHIMNDESVVFGLSQKTAEQRKAAYWLCGLGVAIIWPLGAVLGAMVGKLLPDPETIGLDAVFPAILLALVVLAFKNRTTLIRACSGGVVLSLAADTVCADWVCQCCSLCSALPRGKK